MSITWWQGVIILVLIWVMGFISGMFVCTLMVA